MTNRSQRWTGAAAGQWLVQLIANRILPWYSALALAPTSFLQSDQTPQDQIELSSALLNAAIQDAAENGVSEVGNVARAASRFTNALSGVFTLVRLEDLDAYQEMFERTENEAMSKIERLMVEVPELDNDIVELEQRLDLATCIAP